MTRRTADQDAEVIVVGAGPAGSTVATYLARAGVDVLLLEKTEFPREKVCGDGLTPRGVKQLIDLGIDTSEDAGWVHSRGLRILTGDLTLELDWPDLTSYPPYGVSRTRPPPLKPVGPAPDTPPAVRLSPPPPRLRRPAGEARREGGRAAVRAHH